MRIVKQKIKKVTSTPKGRIIFLCILFVLAGGIIGGVWYWNTHKKSIIRSKLEKAIVEKSQGLYTIHYNELTLDEIEGNMSISGMKIEYDSIAYAKMAENDNVPPLLLRISIPEIQVSGVKTPRALLENEIVGKKLRIISPTFNIYYTYKGKEASRTVPSTEIYKQILGNLDRIKVDTVEISGAQIRTFDLRTGKEKIRLETISAVLTDVAVDSVSNTDTTRLLFSKTVSLKCDQFSWKDSKRPYAYTIKLLDFNSASSSIYIDQFRITPLLAEDAFVKSLPAQDDRFDFVLNKINITDADYHSLLDEMILAKKINIGSASFKIYRDLALPRDKKNRVGTYPHQMLLKLPIPVEFEKVILNNTYIEYKERNHITRKSGIVRFFNTYAAINNVTNRPAGIAKNSLMTAHVNTSLLNKVPMKSVWTFYLGNGNGKFNVKGNVGLIDAREFNPLTEPMGPARIEKGKVNGIDFDLAGHNYGMDGTVTFLYEDLKVAMLEKDKGATEWDKKSLTSFVANVFIKNDNPSGKKEPRTQEVHYQRDTNRSIFHMTWKSLFSGLKLTVGIKK